MTTVVLLNAPKGVGKDELADHILNLGLADRKDMFKHTLYAIAARAAGIPPEDFYDFVTLCNDRLLKEKPCKYFVLNGSCISPRQWLIHISESIVKPLTRATYFGETLASRVKETEKLVIVSDSGFIEEIKPLVDLGHRVVVVRIHREGYTFEGDSRKYITNQQAKDLGLELYDLYNDSTLENYFKHGEELICQISQ